MVKATAPHATAPAEPRSTQPRWRRKTWRFEAILTALPILLALSPIAAAADAPTPTKTAAVLIDEIVAIVNDSAILRQDVYLEARIALARQEGAAAFTGQVDGKYLAATLDRMIDKWVLFEEANRLQVSIVPVTEVDAATADLRASVGAKFFDDYMSVKQVDIETVREIVERGLRVQRYLSGRFRLATKPHDSDVADWYAAHKEEYGRHPLAEVSDGIRDRLTRDRFDSAVATYTAEVRHRAQVRILVDPSAPADKPRNSGRDNAYGPVDAGQGE